VRRITGELAGIAGAAIREATVVIRNARHALRAASGSRKVRLHRAINDVHTIVGRTDRVVAQAGSRLAGVMPESSSRLVSSPPSERHRPTCHECRPFAMEDKG
jgi:IS5 family transposase